MRERGECGRPYLTERHRQLYIWSMDTTIPDTQTRWQTALAPDVLGALGGRYELLEEVGRGGMGAVFRARHCTVERLVALKITLPGASTERFLREARLLAQIHSPHVVTVHDCEVLPNGAPLLVMEWVEGTNLLSRIQARRGPLDEPEVLPW